jgi:hypothetical protein
MDSNDLERIMFHIAEADTRLNELMPELEEMSQYRLDIKTCELLAIFYVTLYHVTELIQKEADRSITRDYAMMQRDQKIVYLGGKPAE